MDREDDFKELVGSDFWVGFNADPTLNVACGAYPTRSGVYSCWGLSGNYLGVVRDGT